MASPEVIDVSGLLEPISDDLPAGSDPREDRSPTSPYQTIKAERNAARAAERNSVHDGNTTEADDHWRKVLTTAPEILKSVGKDLEVASWYIEALVRRHGFQGLRDGFKLVHGLIEKYWDNLYPMPDEDGIETRVSSLSGLNGEGAEGVLIAPIRKVMITEGQSVGPYSFWEYQQALDVQKVADESTKSAKAAKLGFTLDEVEKAVSESSQEFFVNQRDDITQAIDAYKAAGQLLDEHCGVNDAPPIRNIIEVLEECCGAVNHIGKHKFPIEEVGAEEMTEDGAESSPDSTEGAAPAAVQRGPVQSREAAFKQLTEIAEFFRKTEPHSPVSYVLEKAVKWGNMPLNELIQELITDNNSLERFSELTGVKVEN
ncbi:type VI secretion system protein TssA [Teredinibacter sp. KSP-S5-2]|uniref:type VI secretion system protein TssA n=1 Tax=Teredinibacter sp. KSP-S5-2 TaxID=3034506 RepID=UPI0029352BB5|nr:type VI secretion system protein TssA [Teredinibacter sp. KSP-S5-2]WNO08069.1 type VI secretion system protein TssA [Teredinibacter sp. KSP-S5-2]